MKRIRKVQNNGASFLYDLNSPKMGEVGGGGYDSWSGAGDIL